MQVGKMDFASLKRDLIKKIKKKGGGSQLLRAVVNFTAVYIGCLHCFAMQFHIRQE